MRHCFFIIFVIFLSFLSSSCSRDETASGVVEESEQAIPGEEHEPISIESLSVIANAATDWPCVFTDDTRQVYKKLKHNKALAKGTDGACRVWAASSIVSAKKQALSCCKESYQSCKIYDVNGNICGTTRDKCLKAVKLNKNYKGSFNSGCKSTNRKGSYAKFYSFRLSSSKKITIDLTSTVDTYLYLLKGNTAKGTILKSNDDGGTNKNAKITTTLSKGTYTVEATTYAKRKIGKFTLKISTSAGASGDYEYLYRHNASQLGGYTVRWRSKNIDVSGSIPRKWRQEFNRWRPTVRFRFGRAGDITINYSSQVTNEYCGWAIPYWYSDGEIFACRIQLNPNIDPFGSRCEGVIAHEVGHCIGIFKHTSDNGLMDPCSACGTGRITSAIKNMLRLLYSLPTGTYIKSYFSKKEDYAELPVSKRKKPRQRIVFSKRFVFKVRK